MGHHLGQVFIKDKNIIDKIVRESEVLPTDHVLEIGCGEGWFSLAMAEKCRHLTLVELDPECLAITQNRLKDRNNVTFVKADILTIDMSGWMDRPNRVIANIPYYISAAIVEWLVTNRAYLDRNVLMVQKEFAQKLTAVPGTKALTSLTYFTHYFFEVKLLFHVSRNVFRPVPAVDSSVVSLTRRSNLPFEVDADRFFAFIRSAMWARRKTLLNNLVNNPYHPYPRSVGALPFLQQNPNRRADTLTLADFYQLYQEIAEGQH
ncbi:MAG: 16S rRNA (adenine(1518)-N(6)/adenine(1519)-N(6))-dimethyltransferase RsmA [Candidatus Margulisiibacteriota bacterium]